MPTTTKEIEFCLQYHPMDFGGRGNMKELSSICPYTKNGIDTKILARIDEKGVFEEVGVVSDDFETELPVVLKGHTVEFRFAGMTKSGLTQIIGLDVIEPEINATINK